MTSKTLYLLIAAMLIAMNFSCKSYYNDCIHWMDNIKPGSPMDMVKDSQPSFVEIDWSDPATEEETSYYLVKKIKGNHDVLNMSHSLIFKNGRYVGRKSMK